MLLALDDSSDTIMAPALSSYRVMTTNEVLVITYQQNSLENVNC